MSKTRVIRFLLKPKEAERLQEEADKLGLSMSALLRLLIRNWYNGIRFEKDKARQEPGQCAGAEDANARENK